MLYLTSNVPQIIEIMNLKLIFFHEFIFLFQADIFCVFFRFFLREREMSQILYFGHSC